MSIPLRFGNFVYWFRNFLAAIMLTIFSSFCFASSVEQLTFADLCNRAVLIFEGRVVSVETRADDSNFGFGTYVKFEVLDRIKGPETDSQIELRFAGGQMGESKLTIADMQYPEVGQVGIYFVKSLEGRQINPLLGWSQGHFIESIDETGRTSVFSSRGVPILSVAPDLSAGAFNSDYKKQHEGAIVSGTATAKGLELAPPNSTDYQAVSVQEFKDAITERIVKNPTSIDNN